MQNMEKQFSLRSNPHILVADHDRLMREQLERLYSQIGYKVLLVASFEKAQEQLAAGDVDLVVTEIHFPGIGGVELIKRIQEACHGVPVIVITGYRNVETAVTALKLGATDYL